jgi:outer membrane protein assembly factor BamB
MTPVSDIFDQSHRSLIPRRALAATLVAGAVSLLATRAFLQGAIATEANPLMRWVLGTGGWTTLAVVRLAVPLAGCTGLAAIGRFIDRPRLAWVVPALVGVDALWDLSLLARSPPVLHWPAFVATVEAVAVVTVVLAVVVAGPRSLLGGLPTGKQRHRRAVVCIIIVVVGGITPAVAVHTDTSTAAPTADLTAPSDASWTNSSTTELAAIGQDYIFSWDSNRNYIYAFDKKTGEVAWRALPGGDKDSGGAPLAYDNGTVYVAESGKLYAINAQDGSTEWTHDAQYGNGINHKPVVDEIYIFYDTTSNTNGWYRVYRNNGTGNGNVFGNANTQTKFAASAGGTGKETVIYFWNSYDNKLTAWRMDKTQLWETSTPRGPPTHGDSKVYIAANGNVTAYDGSTGSQEWKTALPVDGQPAKVAYSSGRVFVNTTDGLYALDSTDGSPIWQSLSGQQVSPPTAEGGRIYTEAADGKVYTLDPADGSITDSYSLNADGEGYSVVSKDADVLAIRGGDGLTVGGAGFRRTVTGTVTDPSGSPIKNATVRVVADETTSASNPYRDQLEKLKEVGDPIPPSWDRELPLPGEDGFRDTVLDGAPQSANDYVAVYGSARRGTSPYANGDIDLSAPTLNPRSSASGKIPVNLVVWDGDQPQLVDADLDVVEDGIDNSLPGTAANDGTVVIEALGPEGSVTGRQKVEISETMSTGFLASDHGFAYAELSPGFYRVYPESSPNTAYTILVGSEDTLVRQFDDQLENLRGQASERAKQIKDFVNQSGVIKRVSTDAQGRYSVRVPSNVKAVQVTAIKAPSATGLDPKNVTPSKLVTKVESGALGKEPAFLVSEKPRYYAVPNSSADITVSSNPEKFASLLGNYVDLPGNFSARLQEALKRLGDANPTSVSDSDSVRSLLEKHKSLRKQVTGSPPVATGYCSARPADCTDGEPDLLEITPGEGSSLTEQEKLKARDELGAMQTAIDNAPSAGEATSDAGSGTLDNFGTGLTGEDGPPETLTKVISLGGQFDSLEGITVYAVYKGESAEPVPAQYLSLVQGTGPDGNQTSVRVSEWPTPDEGRPDGWTASFDDPTNVTEKEDAKPPTDTLEFTKNTSYNLSVSTFEVRANLSDGSTVTVADQFVSLKNDTAFTVSGYSSPPGVNITNVSVNVLTTGGSDDESISAANDTLTTTVKFGVDVSADGPNEIDGVFAEVVGDGDGVTEAIQIASFYYEVADNETAILVEWPIPDDILNTPQKVDEVSAKTVNGDSASTNVAPESARSLEAETTVLNYNTDQFSNELLQPLAYYADGSSDVIDQSDYSTSGDTWTVSGHPIPEGKEVVRIDTGLKREFAEGVSDSDGTLTYEFDVDYELVGRNEEINESNTELRVQSVNAVLTNGEEPTILPEDYDIVETATAASDNISISGFDYNDSTSVSEVEVLLTNPDPELGAQSINGTRAIRGVTTGVNKDIGPSTKWVVGEVKVFYLDGSSETIPPSQYAPRNSSDEVYIERFEVGSKEPTRVKAFAALNDTSSSTGVDQSLNETTVNTYVDVGANLSKDTVALASLVAEFENTSAERVSAEYIEVNATDPTTVNVTGYTLDPGERVTGWSYDIKQITPSSVDSTDASASGGEILAAEIFLSSQADRPQDVTVYAIYQSGARQQISSEFWSLSPDRQKVTVSGWTVPDGRTVTNAEAVVDSDSAEVTASPGDGNTSQSFTQIVGLQSHTTNDSRVTVTAIYINGSTTTVPTSEWSIVQNDTAVEIAGWTTSGDVDTFETTVEDATEVNANASENTISRRITFSDGSFLSSTELTEDEVTVLARFGDGTSTTVNKSYWRIDRNIGRDDAVVVENWPLPEDARVVTLDVLIATDSGTARYRETIRNPVFSGRIPSLSNVVSNTQFPAVGQSVRFKIVPAESEDFGSLKRVEVTGPNGSSLSVSRPEERTVQFTPGRVGDYTATLFLTNPENETFVERVSFHASATSAGGAPAIRAEQSRLGTFAVVSDGLSSGEVTAEGDQIRVEATTAGSRAPSSVQAMLSDVDKGASSVAVDVNNLDGSDLSRSVTVQVRLASMPDDAIVYAGEDRPLPRTGSNEYGAVNITDSGTIVQVRTGPDGETTIQINRNPQFWEEQAYEFDLFVASLPDIGLSGLTAQLGGSLPGLPGDGIGLVGLLGLVGRSRRRNRGDPR